MVRVNSDGFTRGRIGLVQTILGKKMRLMDKWQISFHKCPWCGSDKTFHNERLKKHEADFQKTGKLYANTFIEQREYHDNTLLFYKKDLCLECGRDWTIQLYCWENIEKKGIAYFNFKTGEVEVK